MQQLLQGQNCLSWSSRGVNKKISLAKLRQGIFIPTIATFNGWLDQGTSVATDGESGVGIVTQSGTTHRFLYKTLTVNPITNDVDLIVKLDSVFSQSVADTGIYNIGFRNSSNGRLLLLNFVSPSANQKPGMYFQKWSSSTTFNSDVSSGRRIVSVPKYLRLRVVSGVCTAYIGNGEHWISLMGSETLSSYLGATGTIDQAVVGCRCPGNPACFVIEQFHLTETP